MVNGSERIKVTGMVEIYNLRTGELMYVSRNLIVNSGLSMITDRLKAGTPNPVSHIAVGTDGTAAALTQTTLGSELARKVCSDISTAIGILTAETIFIDSEAIGHWRECGIFNSASSGTMLNRVVIDFDKTTIDGARVKFTIAFANV